MPKPPIPSLSHAKAGETSLGKDEHKQQLADDSSQQHRDDESRDDHDDQQDQGDYDTAEDDSFDSDGDVGDGDDSIDV